MDTIIGRANKRKKTMELGHKQEKIAQWNGQTRQGVARAESCKCLRSITEDFILLRLLYLLRDS